MVRTMGPYTDVSTSRVEGAYEIYEAVDGEGRAVELLTLGASSSKDPNRRALLHDTVGWAHATRGPADAPIVSADLDAEQPYVAAVKHPGYRGVERMLERMLAMGPPTGPLPVATGGHTGQIPVVQSGQTGQIPAVGHGHTDPRGIPRVVSTPPAGSPVAPASPMAAYVTQSQGTRPPWLTPVIAVLAVLIVAAGGVFIYFGLLGDTDGDMRAGSDDAADEEAAADDDGETPQLREDVAPLIGEFPSFDDSEFSPARLDDVAEPGWPFAFRSVDGMECSFGVDTATCNRDMEAEMGMDAEIMLLECPNDCADSELQELAVDRQFVDPVEVGNGPDAMYASESDGGLYHLEAITIFEPHHNVDDHSDRLAVFVTGIGEADMEAVIQAFVNEVVTQAG